MLTAIGKKKPINDDKQKKKWNRPPTAQSQSQHKRNAIQFGYDAKKEWAWMYRLAAWKGQQGLRFVILRRDPICTECGRQPSTVADHIKDHRGDMKLFLDPKNVRGVCKPCHDKKTGSMHGGGDRKPPAPEPVQNGVVANQGQAATVKPELNDAVDYMELLKRQQR